MTAIVIDDQPLVRLGMQRLLERMPGIGAVHAIDPADIVALAPSHAPAVVVYGMAGDVNDNWYLLRRLTEALPNARILLLSDNMWLRVPAALESRGVVDCLPKTATIERIEMAVMQMVGSDSLVPLRRVAADAWQLHHRPGAMS
ncbi:MULTISPECIES: DNA-binding response regulator [unclassified Cupriavidus]|uniref:DNA-binding response regulator n=1 Tax=unclassified Cupriavidus TaxID=2640874 RepID=UPI0028B52557|nr:DNA-binding response regulator [Cupriavidus sp. SZY C1]MDT6960979.1 DNA-binding response regulator [Cupriavidus sp. SZY C1]